MLLFLINNCETVFKNKNKNDETMMIKHSQTVINIAHDSFITFKNQIID